MQSKLSIFLIKSKDLLTFTVIPEQSALGWHLWGLPRSQTHISQPTFICWPGQYLTPATSHAHSSGSTHCCKWFITKPSGHQQPGVTNTQILRINLHHNSFIYKALLNRVDDLMTLWWPDEHETGDGLQFVPVLICAQETGQGAQRYLNRPGGQLLLAQPTSGHCSGEK